MTEATHVGHRCGYEDDERGDQIVIGAAGRLRPRISLRVATALATRQREPANPEAVYSAMK